MIGRFVSNFWGSLHYELIQNADDVHTADGQPGASCISLGVLDDALFVENDGVFREQDFARMQRIVRSAKRYEADMTGAFGIEFISVYQVTDTPEIRLLTENQLTLHGKYPMITP